MKPFAQAVVIITGGASGIGLALGEQLHRHGARVVLADVDEPGLRRAEQTLIGIDTRVLDVTDRHAVTALVNEIVERRGRIDYLFNNAGIGVGGDARDFAYEDWTRVIEVNLMGVVNGVAAAYPLMIEQGSGHIVNTASVAGLVPLPGELSYVASKYAVVGLSHGLRAEAADLGVRVSVVCPGKIETPIYHTNRFVGFDRQKTLSLLPQGISAERCASIVLRGVARNQATIVVTRLARALWGLERLSPTLMRWASRRYMRLLRRNRLEV